MDNNLSKLPLPTMEVQDVAQGRSTVKIFQDFALYTAAAKRRERYKALPQRFRPALESVSEYVREQMIPEIFNKEGPGWRPLAKRTQEERRSQGVTPNHPILIRSRDLFEELTEKSHPAHIEIIKVGRSARIEIGGSSDKFIQNQTGVGEPGQRLPARPMIPGTGWMEIPIRHRFAIRDIVGKLVRAQLRQLDQQR